MNAAHLPAWVRRWYWTTLYIAAMLTLLVSAIVVEVWRRVH